ncbi:MAG: potassium/proton antiporter [Oscillospiraceae bacterium]|nr:potassium/proton antiporter [Oscillospiraceae bacterium]
MPVYLLLFAALVLFSSVAFNKLSSRLGVPALLAFILLGMLFGSDGLLKIPFDNYEFASQVSSFALIFIMFYGGFGTSWKAAKPVAAQSILLSSLGVVMTALLTGVFCHFVLGFPLLESLLIGAVLGSTDAASVFSILRARNLALKENTSSLLEVESGSNDPCAYMLTSLLLIAMQGQVTGGEVLRMLATQIFWGLAIGFAAGIAASRLMSRLRFGAAGFDTVFVVAAALFAYAAPEALGGNGYLSVYITGIVMGNSGIKNKRTLVSFFDGLTGMMQVVLFFLLGLLSTPSQMPQVIVPALGIALFLTFAARPAAVFLLLKPFGGSLGQKLLVSWSGLRGAASIVFAVMTVISPAVTDLDIFHIVFVVVLLSIGIQGSLLPAVARRLRMIDTAEGADVMKTFTDYNEEAPVQFIRVELPERHGWCGRPLREIALPPQTIIASVRRQDSRFAPNGSTVLMAGDQLILCAPAAHSDLEEVSMTTRRLTAQDLSGESITRVSDLPRQEESLIVLIERNDQWLIPDGDTDLHPGDLLLIHHSDSEI